VANGGYDERNRQTGGGEKTEGGRRNPARHVSITILSPPLSVNPPGSFLPTRKAASDEREGIQRKEGLEGLHKGTRAGGGKGREEILSGQKELKQENGGGDEETKREQV